MYDNWWASGQTSHLKILEETKVASLHNRTEALSQSPRVGLPVAASVQLVPGGFLGASWDRDDAAGMRIGSFGEDPFRVVADRY